MGETHYFMLASIQRLRSLTSHIMSAPSAVSVYLVGAGLVGTQVLHQLAHLENAKQFRVDVIGNSKYQLHIEASERDNIGNLLTLLPPSSAASPKAVPEGFKVTKLPLTDFIKSLCDAQSSQPRLFIDCTSSNDVAELYPALLKSNISIVTPNKKAFSASSRLFNEIQQAKSSKALVYQESTVGAGLPIISTLNDLVATGDKVVKVEGVLSGTLSYIFNEFSKPVKGGKVQSFSEIVKVAKEQGYTEPHPADDLSGSDVARKLCILSRLIPTVAALEKGDEFVAKLPDFDAHYEKMRKEAEEQGQVLRYVGVIDVKGGKVKCGLERYSFDHPFASSLSGSDNIISFHTARYNQRPLIVQGAGAGADVTAMGVVADCLKVAERLL